MRHHGERREELAVLDVRAFPSGSDGDWPCISCGEPFAVSGSWQIHLEEARPVVTCGRCADHARRNGTITLPADMTIDLDPSWVGDRSDGGRG